MILLIDNYDSFTYNLYNQISKLGENVIIKKNDKISIQEIEKLNPDKIVISPGPKDPDSSGISLETIKYFYKKIPILGVCLGHQAIGKVFGVETIPAKKIMHGKTSKISHRNSYIFKGIKSPFSVARYHSLALQKTPLNFIQLAEASDNEIMAIKHKEYPLYGIQFHPESFLTENGDKIMKNFLNGN